MNVVPFGLPWEEPSGRAARLKEAVKVIKLLWTSERESTVSFSGKYYNLHDAFLSQAPIRKPHPPVYVGAMMSRRMLEITGEEGNGWIGWFNTPELFKKKWKTVEEAAMAVGRDPRRIESVSHLMVALPRSPEERREAMLGAKSSLLMENNTLESMGYTNHLDFKQYQNFTVSKEYVDGTFKAAAEIPDEYVHKSMAVGTIEDVRMKVGELSKAGVGQIAAIDMLAPKTTKRTLEIFAKLIREYR